MREVFECVVLQVPGQTAWVEMNVGDRIRLHDWNELVEASPTVANAHARADADSDSTGLLVSAALALQRYDACLMPVEPVGLPWVRMALARVRASRSVRFPQSPRSLIRTPILALAFDIKAPAMADLLELGLSDFVRMPASSEELRARLMHLCQPEQASSLSLREPQVIYGATPPPSAQSRAPRSRGRRSASRLAGINLALYDPEEPFHLAKARIVSGFERAYLNHALIRHEGNVAQAARASRKHRRAFWALLSKYAIDARDYRGGGLLER